MHMDENHHNTPGVGELRMRSCWGCWGCWGRFRPVEGEGAHARVCIWVCSLRTRERRRESS